MTADEYVPDDDYMRRQYAVKRMHDGATRTHAEQEYTRWLTAHDARVRRDAKAEALREIAPHLNDSGDESFLSDAATEYEAGAAMIADEYEAITGAEWKVLATTETTHLTDEEKDYLPHAWDEWIARVRRDAARSGYYRGYRDRRLERDYDYAYRETGGTDDRR